MPPRVDLTGRVYGQLTVVRLFEVLKPKCVTRWLCRCDCGREKIVRGSNLHSGQVSSCGCWKRGLTKTPTYSSWSSMKSRCLNPRNTNYPMYGGRGVRICDRWLESFDNFFADMGERPSLDHSIDRIDVDGHYEPNNCRWADRSTQRRNQRSGRRGYKIEFQGRCMTVRAWAVAIGLSERALGHRLRAGWPVDAALTKPASAARVRAGVASQIARRAKPSSC